MRIYLPILIISLCLGCEVTPESLDLTDSGLSRGDGSISRDQNPTSDEDQSVASDMASVDVELDAPDQMSADMELILDMAVDPDMEVVSDMELLPDMEVVSDMEVDPDMEIVSDMELLPDMEVVSDMEVTPDMALFPDMEVTPDMELFPDMDPPLGPCGEDLVTVYVDSRAGAGGTGSQEAPVSTIMAGINLAMRARRGGTLKLRAGFYEETVSLPNRIHIIGGYDAQWSVGDEESVIIGQRDETGRAIGVIAEDIDCGSTLTSLRVETVDAEQGQSSYGIVARSAPELVLDDVVIAPGAGSPGNQGFAGRPGTDGASGEDAEVVYDDSSCPMFVSGGSPGQNPVCPVGTAGGRLSFNTYQYAPSDACALAQNQSECVANFGIAGLSGDDGYLSLTSPPDAGWWPSDTHQLSGRGGDGQHGQDGGGQSPDHPTYDLTGDEIGIGGGGAGGCGGRGGRGGRAGGSSVGLLALDSPGLTITQSEVIGGQGGVGGAGGSGGAGGAGGAQGAHLACNTVSSSAFDCNFQGLSCTSQTTQEATSSAGTVGGHGGRGGSGGRGATGLSVGIRCHGGAVSWDAQTTLSASLEGQHAPHVECCIPNEQVRLGCEARGGQYLDAFCRCQPNPQCSAQPEECNQIDDDCDGLIDEDFLGTWTTLMTLDPIDSSIQMTANSDAASGGIVLSSLAFQYDLHFPDHSHPNLHILPFDAQGRLRGASGFIDLDISVTGSAFSAGRALVATRGDLFTPSTLYGLTPTERISIGVVPTPDELKVSGDAEGFDVLMMTGQTATWRRYSLEIDFSAERSFMLPADHPPLADIQGSSQGLYLVGHEEDTEGEHLQWTRLVSPNQVQAQSSQRAGEIGSLQLSMMTGGQVYTLWDEQVIGQATTWFAKHLPSQGGEPLSVEISAAGAGTLIAVLPGVDEIVLVKRDQLDLVVGRVKSDGYGAERRVEGFFSDHELHQVIKMGSRFALLAKTSTEIKMNLSALCTP